MGMRRVVCIAWAAIAASTPAPIGAADPGRQSTHGEPDPAGQPDSVHPWRLDRLAFGSCSKQGLPQPLWPAIVASKPQVWLWTGDAIYPDTNSPAGLSDGFASQLQQPGYRDLLSTGSLVEGTYDDHDYGRNDAGKELSTKRESQERYLEFLGVGDARRRARAGIYSSHVFGPEGQRVKLIIMDTRWWRDRHTIPSAVPLLPHHAGVFRGCT
jgi:alkaline phosphatase D